MQIFTIGHSSRSFEEFTQLLQEHGIERLVDVRSFPTSRKFPHFSRDKLSDALLKINIFYYHLRALGGFRKSDLKDSPNWAWENPGFRAYADHMLTDEFHQALRALVKIASEARTTIMCAEAVPQKCHRQLIADALVLLKNVCVMDIVPEGLKKGSSGKWGGGTWFGAFRIPNLVPRSLVNIVGCSSRGRGNCGKLRATSNWASKPVIRSFPSAVRTVEKQLRALASSPPELLVFPGLHSAAVSAACL